MTTKQIPVGATLQLSGNQRLVYLGDGNAAREWLRLQSTPTGGKVYVDGKPVEAGWRAEPGFDPITLTEQQIAFWQSKI